MDDIEHDAANVVCGLLRATSIASLGTLTPDGAPLVTLVTVATDTDGAVIGLFSSLAGHSRNLARDGRASLLMAAAGFEAGDPLSGARASFSGCFLRIEKSDSERERLLGRFLARHPEATAYARLDDFSIYRLAPDSVHLVAGFGGVMRFSGADFLVSAETARIFAAAEGEMIARINRECTALLSRAATRQFGRPPSAWRAVSVDPDGIDVFGEVVRRLPFIRRAREPSDIPVRLAELCDRPLADARCVQAS